MSDDWVALLGVKGGPAIRPGSNMPTSILVRIGGRTVLVDAGLGVARGVCDQGVPLTGIDLIVVTHLHSDHYLELGPLLHTAWTAGLTRPVPIIGPAGLDDYWRHFLSSMAFDIDLRIADEGRVPLAPLAQIATLNDGVVFNEDGLKIEAIRNHHPPIEDSFALRLRAGGKCLVLSGDTAPFDGWDAAVAGADLLVHEAMLTAGVDAVIAGLAHPDPRLRDHILRAHTDAADLGHMATRAGVKALALNHFVPDGMAQFTESHWTDAVRQGWSGPLTIGRDGQRISF
ncbi:MBL fold metallo-hydrolase [Jannaschia pohangensis]|uniref:Ribonuclease BN, tRNA processing enzyme n=1 Tax=Jannaschia pohangensis TaxID=390807 RepID=A0A1I3IJS6_9RHOB|nr:MBL fold metallo-hydrolase [Jannaschia pohangensis]SFI48206.1 Ribonuclease BN, tRNA processing enzyme [Jannaschia pohangensis]